MGGLRLAYVSDHRRRLVDLNPGDRGVVARLSHQDHRRTDRLQALGVTPGARIVVLRTSPAIVFQCDQNELAIERVVASAILIDLTWTAGSERVPAQG
jgi:Fe2+ transport system protein FeoA